MVWLICVCVWRGLCVFQCLLACLFVCLLVCLFVCLFVCLLASLFVCLFVCLINCLCGCCECASSCAPINAILNKLVSALATPCSYNHFLAPIAILPAATSFLWHHPLPLGLRVRPGESWYVWLKSTGGKTWSCSVCACVCVCVCQNEKGPLGTRFQRGATMNSVLWTVSCLRQPNGSPTRNSMI